MEKALIIGDTHGNRLYLERVIEVAKNNDCDGVIVCGDFGYWPKEEYRILQRKSGGIGICLPFESYDKSIYEEARNIADGNYEIPVWFLDGNHEFFEPKSQYGLSNFKEPINEIAPNLFYIPRGYTHRIGRLNVLFMGGAVSVDKDLRTKGVDWFPEESITDEQLDRALSFEGMVHIVLSHDAPLRVNLGLKMIPSTFPNRERLDILLKKTMPKCWMFGHFHVSERTSIDGTDFYGLSADVGSYQKHAVSVDFQTGFVKDILF